jgi:hypothetical protein
MLQIANKNLRLAIVLVMFASAAIAAVWQNQRMKVRAQQANQEKMAASDDLRGRLAAQRRELRDYMNDTPRQVPDAVANPGPSPDFTLGIAGDFFVPGDFDGDGKTDAAVWSSTGAFTIRQSSTSMNTSITLGQSGDDPRVIGNYDSDTRVDAAVYRAGTMSGAYSSWIYHPSAGGPDVTVTCSATLDCGKNGDFPAPGDYDGDGKFDFMVQRKHAGTLCASDPIQGPIIPNADFLLSINGGAGTTVIPCIGTDTDVIVPGDYDGDGKTDIATIRSSAGELRWTIRKSSTNTLVVVMFGLPDTDFPVQGDYDGDGKTDLAVWRPNANPNDLGTFRTHSLASGLESVFNWGKKGDYPVANFNAH